MTVTDTAGGTAEALNAYLEQVAQVGRCGSCQFWGAEPFRFAPAPRECRRNPPSMGGASREGVWPHTHYSDWCGEWKEATEPQIAERRASFTRDIEREKAANAAL